MKTGGVFMRVLLAEDDTKLGKLAKYMLELACQQR